MQADTLAALTRLTHLKLTIHKDNLMGNMEEALAALTGLHSLHVTVASKLEDDHTKIVPLQVMLAPPPPSLMLQIPWAAVNQLVVGSDHCSTMTATCLLLLAAGVPPDRAAAADQP
jgi:hypothetical protein